MVSAGVFGEPYRKSQCKWKLFLRCGFSRSGTCMFAHKLLPAFTHQQILQPIWSVNGPEQQLDCSTECQNHFYIIAPRVQTWITVFWGGKIMHGAKFYTLDLQSAQTCPNVGVACCLISRQAFVSKTRAQLTINNSGRIKGIVCLLFPMCGMTKSLCTFDTLPSS